MEDPCIVTMVAVAAALAFVGRVALASWAAPM
jgi:hypothetical protein